MKRVYISGKISELPFDQVVEKFAKAEVHIEAMGHEPVNPLNNGLSNSDVWEAHMVKDIEMLFGCDAIYLLPCWKDSRGARIEKHIAETTNKVIFSATGADTEIDVVFEAAREIRAVVCRALDVDLFDLMSEKRLPRLVSARRIIAHHMERIYYPKRLISDFLGKERSMVRHYVVGYKDECRFNSEFNGYATAVNNLLYPKKNEEQTTAIN